jgi:hypothetical protein
MVFIRFFFLVIEKYNMGLFQLTMTDKEIIQITIFHFDAGLFFVNIL